MRQTFTIYHPWGGGLNHNLQRDTFQYEKIVTIDAEHIEQAFVLSQNDQNADYAKLNKRSTSIGDIFIDDLTNIQYFCAPMGFEQIPDKHKIEIVSDYEFISEEDRQAEYELNVLESQSPE